MTGKAIRLSRLMDRKTGRSLILPFDHGYFLGPITGGVDFRRVVELGCSSRANALLLTQGIAKATEDLFGGKKGLILRISGTSALGLTLDYEVIVGSVEGALALGADAVAVTIFLGTEREQKMLKGLGQVAEACDRYGMPLLGEIMVGSKLADKAYDPEIVAWTARLGQEAGSDILKLNYPGSPEGMATVVQGCSLPIVIAGGPRMDTEADVLEMAQGALEGGAAGLCVGRNVFQAKDPADVLRKFADIVHGEEN
jgi:fructose-bisphosphate aldolase/2-amino-3,7-dideoxy-D-threo-hept-6-ulosonate synthase